jgi:hypothetical protein
VLARYTTVSVLAMPTTMAWVVDEAPRMEVAHVEQTAPEFVASGMQFDVPSLEVSMSSTSPWGTASFASVRA